MKTNDRVYTTYEIIHESDALKLTFQDMLLAERGYLLTGEDNFVEYITHSTVSFKDHHARLTQLTGNDANQQKRLSQLNTLFGVLYREVVVPMIAQKDNNGEDLYLLRGNASMITSMERSKNLLSTMNRLLTEITDSEQKELHRQQEQTEYWFTIDRVSTYAGPMLIVIVTLLSGLGAVIKLEKNRKERESYQRDLQKSRDSLASVIEGANVGTWEWDVRTDALLINEKWTEMLGYTSQEIDLTTFKQVHTMIHPDEQARSQSLFQLMFEKNQEFYSNDVRLHHKNGNWIWVHVHGKVTSWDAEGNAVLVSGTYTDISERMQALQDLQASEQRASLLIQSMGQGFAHCQIMYDAQNKPYDYRILDVNEAFLHIVEASRKTLIGRTMKELMPEIESFWMENNAKVASGGKPQSFEAYSSVLNKYLNTSSYCPAEGQLAMVIEDISERKVLEQQLHYEKELFETTLLSVGDGVISTDSEARIQFMNKEAEKLTGWRADESVGRLFEEVFKIVRGNDRKEANNPVARVLQEKQNIMLDEDTILISRDGIERFVDDSAAPIRDSKGTITGVVLVFRDSTEKQKKQDEMFQLSFLDPLTELHNRRYYDQARKIMDDVPYYPLTLVLADVNGLKLTNDAFGHEVGDELLKTVATVFRKTCREDDIVTRIGGDEFVLLLPQTDAPHAKRVVERLNEALLKEKIRGIQVSVSFGYATKSGSPESLDTTFKVAEDDMYLEKLTKSSQFKKQTIDSILIKQFEKNMWEKGHSNLVGMLSKAFAQALDYTKDEILQIEQAGRLHDLGKIAVDERILSKPIELNQSEWLELRRHAEIGYNILRSVGEYAAFAEYVLYHHERWDGKGYPQHLKGEDIPKPARMIAIVDSYAAMISDRPYKKTLTQEQAIEELRENCGTQFDPSLVEVFIEKVLNV